jgi:hypothetical protein
MESFLDVECIEVFPLECDGCVHRLFEDLLTILELFGIASKCDLAILETPIQLLSLGTEIFDDVS